MSSSEPRRSKKWNEYVTVEPTMFFYMFAFQLTSVIEQELFVQKACRVNLNYSAKICDNLLNQNNTNISKEVQKAVSVFHQWNGIAGHLFPIVIALFFGSWSDKRGRKIPIIIGLVGKLIYDIGIMWNIHYFAEWPVEYIIYTATLPCALTGADIVIFASAFAYISDITSVENRTFRITILEVCYLVTMPVGIALGQYLFESVVNRSYMIMFSINTSILVASIVYSLVQLKHLTSPKQRPISEVGCRGLAGDFFDKKHVADSFRTLSKKRTNHGRIYLWMLLAAMFFYVFQRDERPYTFLYTKDKFKWDIAQFSGFKVFQSATYILMLLFGVPVMSKLFKWQDTTIAMIGAFNFTVARICYSVAQASWLFYVGAFISCIGPVGGPIIRSMTSKVIPSTERGKVFALLSVCDNAVPLVSTILYTQVYNNTVGEFPGIFILTAISQIILFILMMMFHISLRGRALGARNSDATQATDTTDVNGSETTIDIHKSDIIP